MLSNQLFEATAPEIPVTSNRRCIVQIIFHLYRGFS